MQPIRDVRRVRPTHPMATPMSADQIKRRRLERSVAKRLEVRRLVRL